MSHPTSRKVEVVHWNPAVGPAARLTNRLPWSSRINNFGDLLGPVVVQQFREALNLKRARGHRRLLTVGSILRLARTNDVVWGTGANGKSLDEKMPFSSLDVRAVRGPLTREFLLAKGVSCPAVFGDPALLLGHMWPRAMFIGDRRNVTILPNLHDLKKYDTGDSRVVDPRWPLSRVLACIARSDFVVGSSLHAIVMADAWGIPARLIRSSSEPDFKYLDYFLGSGRDRAPEIADDLAHALRLGPHDELRWDATPLIEAFPADLWMGEKPNDVARV